VIIESGEEVIGILVDSVSEVVEMYQSDIESAPSVGTEESSRYIQGVATRSEDLLIVVDVEKLLNEDEKAELRQVS
jgi:purine-binding chemotaxis protein CheW